MLSSTKRKKNTPELISATKALLNFIEENQGSNHQKFTQLRKQLETILINGNDYYKESISMIVDQTESQQIHNPNSNKVNWQTLNLENEAVEEPKVFHNGMIENPDGSIKYYQKAMRFPDKILYHKVRIEKLDGSIIFYDL